MNVLVIAPQPFYSERGTPIAVRHLVETLCGDGHRVDLLTYPFGDDLSIDGLTIHRCGRLPGIRGVPIGFSLAKVLTDVPLLVKLYRMSKAKRYDAVHAVEESIYGALLLRPVHGASVIYDMDSSLAEQLVTGNPLFRPLGPLLRRIEQWAIESADLVAPMCQDLASYAGTFRDDEVSVLHDIPLQTETPSAASRNPERLRGASHRLLALYVGNLEEYQGIDLLVESVAQLPERCSLEVVVVGGPMARVEHFRKIVERRALGSRLRFIGPRPVSRLEQVLAEADILLSPRTQGGNTPLKLYSYMAAGRPILATRLRTHTQVLDDSTALLVDPEPDAFARGLLRLTDDSVLRRDLGDAAKQRVARRYSLSSFRSRVRDVYGRSRRLAARMASDVSSGGTLIADRRTSGDRRTGSDRRSALRGGFDRRTGDRRTIAYA